MVLDDFRCSLPALIASESLLPAVLPFCVYILPSMYVLLTLFAFCTLFIYCYPFFALLHMPFLFVSVMPFAFSYSVFILSHLALNDGWRHLPSLSPCYSYVCINDELFIGPACPLYAMMKMTDNKTLRKLIPSDIDLEIDLEMDSSE